MQANARHRFEHAIEQRHSGTPVAYVTGLREFWSMELVLTIDVLIPRPETELLVELALERIDKNDDTLLADLGTGSGAVALAIAKERPRCQVLATDASDAALKIAQQNAQRLKIDNIEFVKSDWLEAVNGKEIELIVSNPPYICADDPHLDQGDLLFEPHAALVSGVDGLDDIRQIAYQSPHCLKPGGFLMVEHGSEQSQAVREIFAAQGFIDAKTHNDLAGLPRVCIGKIR